MHICVDVCIEKRACEKFNMFLIPGQINTKLLKVVSSANELGRDG